MGPKLTLPRLLLTCGVIAMALGAEARAQSAVEAIEKAGGSVKLLVEAEAPAEG